MWDNESLIRLGLFLIALFVLAALERKAPRRVLTESKSNRWFVNLSMAALGTGFVRLTFPVLPFGVAMITGEHHAGLLNYFSFSPWVGIPLAVVVLDFFLYFQHVLLHFLPGLWRIHIMHHTDLDFDLTTGVRFHPIEIMVSAGIKMAVVYMFGLPVQGVLLYEVLLNPMSMLTHSNLRLPLLMDRWLRYFVVTPDMHRIHHSVIIKERNSNFSASLSCWDRFFGTYREQPEKGHNDMVIGVGNLRDFNLQTIPWLLALPFTEKAKS